MTIAKNHSGVVYSAIPLNGDAESTTIAAASSGGIRVQVEAPASLAEGFSFLASYQGRMFSVTVPPGGVEKGQKMEFMAPVDERAAEIATSTSVAAAAGKWKDGLFGCFYKGICSEQLWCAWCCRPFALGKIMQRVGLSCMANPVPEERAKSTFHTVFFVYVFLSMLYSGLPFPTVDSEGTVHYGIWTFLKLVIYLLLLIWKIWALTKTRAHVRSQDQIPEEQCRGCEDLCCALFCSCCAVAQLYSHTEDMDSTCHPMVPPSNTLVVIEAVGIV